ncbi:MAG: ethylbenzene dehydrogenase-related protein [Aestuariivirga sp.]|nr:ethylbenzene dehydrogenase-related protein [Aestuariivirga sp.]
MAADVSAPVDWAAIPARMVMLFYPGQSSYQWLRGTDHPAGMAAVAGGTPCSACHRGQEAALGERIVAGGSLEPDPIAGKRGAIELRVQAAYDNERLYLRLQWPTQSDRPGQVHDFLRYDGQSWAPFGGPRSKPVVRSGAMPALYEDRLGIALDDGTVPSFEQQGCWLACHDGMRDMQRQPPAEQVRAHGLLGRLLGQEDVRKYLPDTRDDTTASWNRTRPTEAIAALKAAGAFLELMQWRAARSNPVGMADDGHVLEYRLSDAGVGPFVSNLDRGTKAPRYMFDQTRTGFRSLALEQITDRSEPYALVREGNAAPYDPDAGWQAGDLLPSRVLSRADAQGSAADNRDVVGSWDQGTWTVVWARPLDTGNPEDDKPMRPGERYTVSFSVHDDNVTTRFHHVSFPLRLGIGVNADITAVRVE